MFLETTWSLLIFALVPLAVKFTDANPYDIGLLRLLMAVVLLAFFWRRKIEWRAYKKVGFSKIVLLGTCFFLHWITYTFAVKWAGPSMTVLGMSSYGVQLMLWGALFLGNKITTKSVLCLIAIIFGVFLVIPEWDFANNGTLGLILALLSATFYSFIPVILQKTKEFKTETRIFFQFFIALFGYLFLIGKTDLKILKAEDWYALIFLGVFGTFIAHTLWSKVTSVISTNISAILYYLVTPITMALAVYLFNERLSALQITGALIILVGSFTNLINKQLIHKIFHKKAIHG